MRRCLLITAALLALAAPAEGHVSQQLGVAPRLVAGEPCPGSAGFRADVAREGSFGAELQGAYVMVPLPVRAGTTQVRVRYCHDQPDSAGVPNSPRHTIDLGLWDPDGFRGWGGSSHPEVQITPQGFSTEAQYLKAPKGNVPGRTTRGYRPGPIPAGTWEAELGVASVATQGDRDGRVAWRVELELSSDPAYAAEPYVPAPYDATPAKAGPGFYGGDLHVHAEHSALGDATMTETFTYGFGAAGLDFIMLSDYVTDSAWGEIGRKQGDFPGKLVARSSEVITYQGHIGNHVSGRYVDHRAGPVHALRADGTTALRRAARPASALLGEVRQAGGFTQVNHPTIFPSQVPGFSGLCRGCPWDFPGTDYGLVDAIEVSTGPPGAAPAGNNPFTTTAIDFYERALDGGARIAAVGVSDSHNAGRTNGPTQAPVGTGMTVVYADELSEEGLRRAVRARHTSVKIFGASGPELRLEARAPGTSGPPAIHGDVVRASSAQLTARVLGGDRQRLELIRDGVPVAAAVVSGADARIPFTADRPGRYRLQLADGNAVTALTSPVWLDPAAVEPAGAGDDAMPARVRLRVGPRRRLRTPLTCSARGLGLDRCVIRMRVRGKTVAKGRAPLRGGRARITLKLTKAGRELRRRRGSWRATLHATAGGSRGSVGPHRKRLSISDRRSTRRR